MDGEVPRVNQEEMVSDASPDGFLATLDAFVDQPAEGDAGASIAQVGVVEAKGRDSDVTGVLETHDDVEVEANAIGVTFVRNLADHLDRAGDPEAGQLADALPAHQHPISRRPDDAFLEPSASAGYEELGPKLVKGHAVAIVLDGDERLVRQEPLLQRDRIGRRPTGAHVRVSPPLLPILAHLRAEAADLTEVHQDGRARRVRVVGVRDELDEHAREVGVQVEAQILQHVGMDPEGERIEFPAVLDRWHSQASDGRVDGRVRDRHVAAGPERRFTSPGRSNAVVRGGVRTRASPVPC